jgi:aminotransferase
VTTDAAEPHVEPALRPVEPAQRENTGRPPLAKRALAERVQAVPPSGIRRFFDILATMDDVISLGIGEPDFDTPARVVEAGIASLRRGRTHYTSNYGTIELRRALADHLERRYGVRYDPEREILVTVGASEAVDLALRATCDPGDEVVLHEPSYVAYAPAVIFAGGLVRHVATRLADDFALDPAAVEAAITPRTKALFLGYPCNPTGAVLPDEVADELARIAERHDLLVFSDEIYDRLAYGTYRHRAFSGLPGMRERTVLMGGFSKAYAMTGWRVGWLCAPASLIEGIVKVHQYSIMSAPTTAQDAALVALTEAEDDVRRMVTEYDRRRRLLVDGLNRIGLRTFEPRGAFYAFPEVTSATGLSSEAFAEALLEEERVAVIPGNAFGPSGEGHVRACYATAYEQLEEAIARFERFMDRHRAA